MKDLKNEVLLVKKHNYSLFANCSKMDLTQYKIMNLVISKIDNSLKEENVKDENLLISFTKEELETEYLKARIVHKRLIPKMEHLMEKRVRYTRDLESKNPTYKSLNIFSYYEYKNNVLDIKINKDIISYFVELKSNFTQYYFKYLTDFTSIYSVVSYEILKMNEFKFSDKNKYKKIEYIQFSMEELFQIYGLSTKSTRTYSFLKDKVLDISKKEINNYSDINFNYEPVKEGRKIVAIQFYLYEDSDIETQLRNKPKHLLKDWENLLLLALEHGEDDPVRIALMEQVNVMKKRSENSVNVDLENRIFEKSISKN